MQKADVKVKRCPNKRFMRTTLSGVMKKRKKDAGLKAGELE